MTVVKLMLLRSKGVAAALVLLWELMVTWPSRCRCHRFALSQFANRQPTGPALQQQLAVKQETSTDIIEHSSARCNDGVQVQLLQSTLLL